MNTHPMKYVGMIDRLLEEGSPPVELRCEELLAARTGLIEVASAEAKAYSVFKTLLKELASDGHPLASKFNDKTYVDLT